MVLECNKRPLLEEEPTEADERRIIDLLFGSMFKDNENIKEKIFKKNIYYTTDEFRERYKSALLKILFEHNKEKYKKDLIKPKEVELRTRKYMEGSVELFEWFNETFEKTGNKNEHIQISQINNMLKESEYYQTLSKQDKRKLTREKLTKIFKENVIYKKYFRDEENTHVNGKKVKDPKRLLGYKIKEN